ncbi:MAG: DinB family protein [Acidobacteriota bacterium]
MSLVPELEKIRQEIESINDRAVGLCEGLGEEELGWRPGPVSWSIAENLVHLKVTTEIFLPGADRAIDEARQRNLIGWGPFRLGLMGRIYLWYVEPPPRIRLPAPKPLRPLLRGPATQALPEFLAAQQSMAKRLEAANGLDLCKARITSPLAKYIRMSLLAFFSVFTGHGRRHLWQASNVRRQLPQQRDPK